MTVALAVERVSIRRFKNLKQVALKLAPTNLIVGPNNSGKSAILQAIQFMTSAAQCVGADGLIPRDGHHAATISPTDLYYSPVDEVAALSYGAELTQNWERCIRLSITVNDGMQPSEEFFIQIARGKNGNLAIRTNGAQHWATLASLQQPFCMYVPGLAGIAPNEQYATPAAVRKAAARGHGNAVLRNVLWQLNRLRKRWEMFEEHLDAVFPGTAIVLSHDPEFDGCIQAQVCIAGAQRPLGLAGTGLLQTLQILAYVHLYSPSLLLLDEPDSHIHPDKQRALLSVVTDWASTHQSKVLIATHSRHLLDSMGGDASFHWMQEGQRHEEEDFDRVKVLMDLGALDRSDRLRNGEIAGVVLTEDATAADDHRKSAHNPLRRLLQANGVDLSRVQVWAYEGCTKVDSARILARFIMDHAPGAAILVHRDRDYLSETEVKHFREAHASTGIRVFVTSGTDVESYFLSPEHVATVFDLAKADAEVLLRCATQETHDESVDAFSRSEMGRERQRRRLEGKGGEPSPAEVTQRCLHALGNQPERYRHGKKTLKALRQLIAERHLQGDLLVPSDHLVVDELRGFAASVETDKRRP